MKWVSPSQAGLSPASSKTPRGALKIIVNAVNHGGGDFWPSNIEKVHDHFSKFLSGLKDPVISHILVHNLP